MMIDATIPSRLADRELIAEVARLARDEREATTSLIAHLAELYGRRLHERAGFSSLFTYCTTVLRLSEHEAFDRMKAAKIARRYPPVLGLLASGCVNLTTVRLLAPHLTRENREELFAAASGKNKRQVQELLARWFPRPDVAPSIRKLPVVSGSAQIMTGASRDPVAALAPGLGGHDAGSLLMASAAVTSAAEVPARAFVPAPARPVVQPLAPDRYRVTFTADAETCEMLELAQDLLRHALPSGEPAQIVKRSLRVFVEQLVRDKYAVTTRPRAGRTRADDAREPSAEVKRAVFLRDRGRCVFVGTDGRKCGERGFMEFHHVIPYAAGGKPTVENIDLRCRAHNGYEAEVFFGPARRYVTDAVALDTRCAVSPKTRFRSGTTEMTDDWRTLLRARDGPAPLPSEHRR